MWCMRSSQPEWTGRRSSADWLGWLKRRQRWRESGSAGITFPADKEDGLVRGKWSANGEEYSGVHAHSHPHTNTHRVLSTCGTRNFQTVKYWLFYTWIAWGMFKEKAGDNACFPPLNQRLTDLRGFRRARRMQFTSLFGSSSLIVDTQKFYFQSVPWTHPVAHSSTKISLSEKRAPAVTHVLFLP